MKQIVSPVHRVYNVPDEEAVRERIVLNWEDFNFKDRPSDSVLVINKVSVRGLCAALEITSLDGEVQIHFVLSDGFEDRHTIKYAYGRDTIQRLAEYVRSNIDSSHIIRDIEIEADLIDFFDKPYLPAIIDPAIHQKRLLGQLSAKWLARYIAYNYKISATVHLAGKTLAESYVEIGLNLPCSPALGYHVYCSIDSPNAEAWYFVEL